MRIKIDKLSEEDLADLVNLHQECGLGSWSLDSYKNEYNNPLATYYVAKEKSQLVGFAGIWCIVDEAQLMNIGVKIDYRKKGIAASLLNELIASAQKAGCVKMYLEVKASNTVAIEMYKSLGFIKSGFRENYYDGEIDAILMEKKLF